MMNPADIMKIMGMRRKFEQNHPKFFPFLSAVSRRGIQEGTVIEIKVTNPEGESLESNFRVTESDLELFRELRSMNPNG